jgi:hypothetical protein
MAGLGGAVFGDQPYDLFPAPGGRADEGELRVRTRVDHYAPAQSEHRVEHRAHRAGKRFIQAGGSFDRSAPTEEDAPIGLKFPFAAVITEYALGKPNGRIGRSPWPALRTDLQIVAARLMKSLLKAGWALSAACGAMQISA